MYCHNNFQHNHYTTNYVVTTIIKLLSLNSIITTIIKLLSLNSIIIIFNDLNDFNDDRYSCDHRHFYHFIAQFSLNQNSQSQNNPDFLCRLLGAS